MKVKPQTYEMKLGPNAAYLSGTSFALQLNWDVDSKRWQDADWSDFNMEFTFGINSESIVGQQYYTFVAKFKDLRIGQEWEPLDDTYSGLIDTKSVLVFDLIAGNNPPQPPEGLKNHFPYILKAKLLPFADTFNDAMLCGQRDLQGTVYGLQGKWKSSNTNGLYLLDAPGTPDTHLIGIYDGKLVLNQTPIETSQQRGRKISWSALQNDVAKTTGLPKSGYIEFSEDGEHIVNSSLNGGGRRVSPDEAATMVDHLPRSPKTASVLVQPIASENQSGGTLRDLINMTQFEMRDGNYYDAVQEKSMEDFYDILQYYMPEDLRKTFFNPNPVHLDPTIKGIARLPGKNQPAQEWYSGLGVTYTTATLANYSNEPAAATLNGIRAENQIRNQSGISDVIQVQAPLLYANRYKQKSSNSKITWFLNDQEQNASKYNPIIDEEMNNWIKELEENLTADGDPEQKQKVIDETRKIGQEAKDRKKYWAFTFMRYAMTPNYLNLLQIIVFLGDDTEGSEFARRVQRSVALLNILDTEGFCSAQYTYTLQLFQVASILPQLFDYSEDFEDFNFAVKQIIDQFVQNYIDSPDPKMQEAAEALKKHATQETVSQILLIFRTSAGSTAGLYSWERLVEKFQIETARRFSKILPKAVVNLTVLSSISLLITFFATGEVKWSELSGGEKLRIIGAASGIVAQFGIALFKRGVALNLVFTPQVGLWQNIKLFFTPNLLKQAQLKYATGFKGWLVNETGAFASNLDYLTMNQMFAETAQEAAEFQAKINRSVRIQKLFGRNLGELLATRLGAILSLLGMIMAATELPKAEEPLEVAATWLFFAASTLEFIAKVGHWAIQAYFSLGTKVLGLSVSSILSVVSVIGVLALIAGTVLIAILLFRSKQSPVENFATGQAAKAGLYMKFKTDIDYFQDYQNALEPQKSGVSLAPNSDSSRSLYMDVDGTLKQEPFDATGHTAFYLRVDDEGRAQFGAPMTDEQRNRTFLILTLDNEKKLLAGISTEDSLNNAQQLWVAEMQGDATWAGDYLEAAPFKLYNAYWVQQSGERLYLTTSGDQGWTTSSDGTSVTLEMVTTKPEQLTMPDIVWFTYQHDEKQGPSLSRLGSAPRKWSLTPELPPGLCFNPENGFVAMERGVDVPVAPKKTYTLSVKNVVGSAETTFTLEIRKPEAV